MWRTYTESGTLRYSFIDSLVAMHPYYIARAFGGLLFLIGIAVGTYNVLMTIRRVPDRVPVLDYPTASEASEPPVPAAE
jgi:cytochrome c oxidase cbb3-type subunit 1